MQEISDTFSEDFGAKLKINISDGEKLAQGESFQEDEQHQDEESDDDDEEFEFSFVTTDHDGSPISAEDVFSNGEIRPIFPLFNRDLLFAGGYGGDSNNAVSLRSPLRKVFIEERDLPSSSGSNEAPIGEYCVWTGKASDASPEICKKSNSTGFSKLWRFRDLMHRCSSDGKDAFVFLRNPSTKTKATTNNERIVKIVKVERRTQTHGGEVRPEKRLGAKGKTSSAHEKHYVRNRATNEGNRRRSYLPYKQDLVGFFTSVNGLSRNVHPY